MGLFRELTRGYLINRLARGGRHRRRGRAGFFGPFPSYSRRTRGGSRVTVTGCCLPIPLGVLGVLGAAALAARLSTRR